MSAFFGQRGFEERDSAAETYVIDAPPASPQTVKPAISRRVLNNGAILPTASILRRHRRRPSSWCPRCWRPTIADYNRGQFNLHRVTEIFDAAQTLNSSERAQLLAALWDTVAPSDWVPPDVHWIAEASRRSDALDAGDMTSSTWAEVRERARRMAGLDG